MSLSCPSDESLSDYLLGRMPAGTIRDIQHHLDECGVCAARMDRLQVDHRSIRFFSDSSSLVPRTVKDWRLAQLATQQAGLARDNTPTIAADSEPNAEDDPFPFLGRSADPADLGRLAGYRVVQLIGRGGMGYVFRAIDEQLGRAVGLKVLRPKATLDESARTRFLDEARAMAAVRHDHIAVIYQVGETTAYYPADEAVRESGVSPKVRPGTAFLAMELLDGQSLQEWMRANRHPPMPVVTRIAREITAGLAAAHARGLIHRDVKPSNLWLQAPPGWEADALGRADLGIVGRVKVIDFGLAAPVEGDRFVSTIAGTPAYMAPEQFIGSRPDARSDLFSLGCVLYELCTGAHPFPARLRGRVGDPEPAPTPARELNPAVPAELSRLVGRLLAADPVDRPASALDVARELAGIEHSPTRPSVRKASVVVAACTAGVIGVATAAIVGWPQPDLGSSPGPLGPPPPVRLSPASSKHEVDTGVPPAIVDRPPFPAGPPDARWCRTTALQTPDAQFQLVAMKLAKVNPGYDPKDTSGWIEPELVVRFKVKTDKVTDLRPIPGLRGLGNLMLDATLPGGGRVTDLGPLAGMPLVFLHIHNNFGVCDLRPLRGMALEQLTLVDTRVESLTPLAGSPLRLLDVSGCPIADLRPVATLSELETFRCIGCPIRTYEPLAGGPIVHLWADLDPDRDAAILKRMPKLETLNGRPVVDK